MLEHITPVILTYNEQANIERTLNALSWANEILVVDSFSTDQTLELCQQYKNVRIVQRQFDDPANQCNFALQQNIKTEWVMSMDADYVVTPELVDELKTLSNSQTTQAYEVSFNYLINGQAVVGSLYPPRTVLYKKQHANYRQDGHTQRVTIDGSVEKLDGKIQHDDRKSFDRWLNSQKKYAKQEVTKLAEASWGQLSWPDRMRAIGIAPILIVPYSLIIKGSILSGWPGLVYTGQRFIAEVYLQLARLKLF